MHARVTTLQLQPDRLDQAVSQLEEEDLPRWREIDGFRGFTLLADRSSGKVIGTSYWDSEEQMRASEEAIRPSRARAAETGGASAEPQVEPFEVALDTFVR
jgi:heme-degrading monooxygenase HmoA